MKLQNLTQRRIEGLVEEIREQNAYLNIPEQDIQDTIRELMQQGTNLQNITNKDVVSNLPQTKATEILDDWKASIDDAISTVHTPNDDMAGINIYCMQTKLYTQLHKDLSKSKDLRDDSKLEELLAYIKTAGIKMLETERKALQPAAKPLAETSLSTTITQPKEEKAATKKISMKLALPTIKGDSPKGL